MTHLRDASETRGAIWHQVWADRQEDHADWNGAETCFPSFEDYERWTHRLAATIRRELNFSAADVVADLGCGTGRTAALIAPYVSRVLAFDYSEAVLAVAERRRPRPNVTYGWADLNQLEPERLPVTKAYAVGSLHYLDSEAHVVRLIAGFYERGISFAAIDFPDATILDQRGRSYDTSVYTHLRIDPATLVDRFPSGRVVRGEFPEYANSSSRFSFYLDGSEGRC